MALIPLKIPPGMYRNGTEYESAGRWNDGNLVRWADGVMRPVGGWRQRVTSAATGRPCGLSTWADNAAARWAAIGTHSKLYGAQSGVDLYDITPAGYTVGRADAVAAVGYGSSTYGSGAYGTPRPITTTAGVLEATTWALDNWGQRLLACASTDGRIYEWDRNTAAAATVLTNAPTQNRSMIVTAERFVFALGANGNPRLVQWSDQENNTVWTPAATNQAGSNELQTMGRIISARKVRGGTLILTDADAHLAQYAGPPFIYRFERVGAGCGLIGANAIAAADAFCVWMSRSGFWLFDSYAQPLPSDVSDYVYSDINLVQASKIAAVHVAKFGEVWWYYPSGDSNECNRYVVWSYRDKYWATGSIARTVGTDAGVFEYPLVASPAGIVYEHEVGYGYDGAQPFAESGPIELGAGDRVMSARQLVPDERTQGDVQARFKLRFYPNAAEQTVGPYAMGTPTSVRFTARQVRMRVEALRAADWRVGTMRLEAVPGSER